MPPFTEALAANDPQRTVFFSRARQGMAGDRKLASLFTSATTAITDVVGIVDKTNQNEIGRDIAEAKERIQSPFIDPVLPSEVTGLASEDDSVADPSIAADAPDGLKRGFTRLDKRNQALAQKKITQTQYNGEILAEVRRLRTDFPGYTDIIDQKIKQSFGRDPANDIVRLSFQNARQAENRAFQEGVRQRTLVRNLQGRGLINRELAQGVLDGTTSLDTAMLVVGREQRGRLLAAEKATAATQGNVALVRAQGFEFKHDQLNAAELYFKGSGLGSVTNAMDMLNALQQNPQMVTPQIQSQVLFAINGLSAAKLAAAKRYLDANPELAVKSGPALMANLREERDALQKTISGSDDFITTAKIPVFIAQVQAQATFDEFKSTLPEGTKLLFDFLLNAKTEASAKAISDMLASTSIADKKGRDLIRLFEVFIKSKEAPVPIARGLGDLSESLKDLGVGQTEERGRLNEFISLGHRYVNDIGFPADERLHIMMGLYDTTGMPEKSLEDYYQTMIERGTILMHRPIFEDEPILGKAAARGIMDTFRLTNRKAINTLENIAGSNINQRLGIRGDGTLFDAAPKGLEAGDLTTPIGEESLTAGKTLFQEALDIINTTIVDTVNALKTAGVKDQKGVPTGTALLANLTKAGDGSEADRVRAQALAALRATPDFFKLRSPDSLLTSELDFGEPFDDLDPNPLEQSRQAEVESAAVQQVRRLQAEQNARGPIVLPDTRASEGPPDAEATVPEGQVPGDTNLAPEASLSSAPRLPTTQFKEPQAEFLRKRQAGETTKDFFKRRQDALTQAGKEITAAVSDERRKVINVTDERINDGEKTQIPTFIAGTELSKEAAIQAITDNNGFDPDTGHRLDSNKTIEGEGGASSDIPFRRSSN